MSHFARALELAERGRGKTGDHPLVGAVVVRDGEVVGEGWYEFDGVRHAEAIALEQAGDAARGATLYVTLEPCSHHGRTPPCADAVVAAGVARVVVGARDPNPVVDGRGLELLRAAGIEVELLDDLAARRQNEAWRVWKSLGRPFVTYKAAITLDGRVAVPGRRWVSGEESRRRVHELRAASDAVAVGMGTVRADSPRLDAREVEAASQPRRLAFGHGPLPEGPSSSCAAARSRRSFARSPPKASSRSCSRAGRRSRQRSSPRASWTSCSSSSRRSSPARARTCSASSPRRSSSSTSEPSRPGKTCLEAYLHEP